MKDLLRFLDSRICCDFWFHEGCVEIIPYWYHCLILLKFCEGSVEIYWLHEGSVEICWYPEGFIEIIWFPYLSIISDTIVPNVSPCLRSLVLLRTTKLIEYSTLVLYSPRTGNIFSEKKLIWFLSRKDYQHFVSLRWPHEGEEGNTALLVLLTKANRWTPTICMNYQFNQASYACGAGPHPDQLCGRGDGGWIWTGLRRWSLEDLVGWNKMWGRCLAVIKSGWVSGGGKDLLQDRW